VKLSERDTRLDLAVDVQSAGIGLEAVRARARSERLRVLSFGVGSVGGKKACVRRKGLLAGRIAPTLSGFVD